MFQYRAVLVRLRQGDSDRDIARSRSDGPAEGRRACARWRRAQGWLAADAAAARRRDHRDGDRRRRAGRAAPFPPSSRTATSSCAGLQRGVNGIAIHAALCREHGYTGSYSAVRRMLGTLAAARSPEATVRLQFAPGEAAQVDFGAGPLLVDPARGEVRRTWAS